MLVRIKDRPEAVEASIAGVDAIELRVEGELDLAVVAAIRDAFDGTMRLHDNSLMANRSALLATAALGIDEIAADYEGLGATFGSTTPNGQASVAVLSDPSRPETIDRLKGFAQSLMLDTRSARLIDTVEIATLDAFASSCRSARLPFGLSGGLEAPDVARLLLLDPDVLGFDVAVRQGHRADGPLDAKALDAIRALIPRRGDTSAAFRLEQTVTDRIFVRDFAISLAIGAYQAEHGKRQRVRFSVEADVSRRPVAPHDMRDVFSYDVILETIRVLSQRPHVTFVETLAEEVATALLAHADLTAVTVKVEKLDVIDGAVGIEITRRQSSR